MSNKEHSFDYWSEQVQRLVGEDIDINWLMACYNQKRSIEDAADRISDA